MLEGVTFCDLTKMVVDHSTNALRFEAEGSVGEAVAALGRTEDVKFSPSNHRLAIADHFRDKIVVFDLALSNSVPAGKRVVLTNAIEISSSHLRRPHGLDFIDDEKIIVANREGHSCIFAVPDGATGKHEANPIAVLTSPEISSPGSVAVSMGSSGASEILICSDYSNKVSKHSFNGGASKTDNGRALLQKWIRFPDGICISEKKEWIAVSNHDTHAVFIYKNDDALGPTAKPVGLMRHYYPHGLRFVSDDQFLLATSAGSPFLNIYEASNGDWRGVRNPALTVRVLSDDDFLRCRISREDGGPKGVDVNRDMDLLVVTCENIPLQFFDLQSILQQARSNSRSAPINQATATGGGNTAKIWPELRDKVQLDYHLCLGHVTGVFTKQIRWVLTEVPILSRGLNAMRRLMRRPMIAKPF